MQTLNQTALASALGLSVETVSRLRRQGAITPVIKERMVIRFDLDQVRQQLAERAKNHASPII